MIWDLGTNHSVITFYCNVSIIMTILDVLISDIDVLSM